MVAVEIVRRGLMSEFFGSDKNRTCDQLNQRKGKHQEMTPGL